MFRARSARPSNFDGTSGSRLCRTNPDQPTALGRATNPDHRVLDQARGPLRPSHRPVQQRHQQRHAAGYLRVRQLYADLITTNGANYILGAPWNIVNSNTWQHAALTYDGTNAMIYYNGQPVLTNYLGATNNLLLQTIQWLRHLPRAVSPEAPRFFTPG